MKALQIDAVCDKLGVGRTQVYKFIRAGKLDARKLALQLLYLKASESMGNHDSKVVDADSVD